MIGSARKKLLQLQKGIFHSLQQDAHHLLGGQPPAIRRYEREFQRDFTSARIGKDVGKAELIRAIRRADVTLIADYHTFGQAQRTAVRLIREAIRPGENWVIGLELIPSQFQRALDDYQDGRIELEEFHRIIQYEDQWGFPWKNYAPIFDWARENRVRLVALNLPQELVYRRISAGAGTRSDDLEKRDEWAAGIISDLFGEHPARRPLRMIVLYGELHVATRHLPAQIARVARPYLGRRLTCATIHQNHDATYWKLADAARELHTHALQLPPKSKNAYCVFSSTPWSKLQSLVTWAEGGILDEEPELETDYLSLMLTYGKTLARFFGVDPPPFESLTLRTIEQADFVDDLLHDDRFSAEERRLLRFHVLRNQRIFIPRASIAYLASPSQNGAAELASIFVLRHETRSSLLFRPEPDDFYRLVLEACFGFLGSLILNPRRKCDLVDDHAERITALRGKRGAHPDAERDARRLALRILRGTGAGSSSNSKGAAASEREIRGIMAPRRSPAAMLASRFVGHVLGKRLHQALLADHTGRAMEEVRAIFFGRWGTRAGEFLRRYASLLKIISRHRVAPSKQQTL